MDNPAPTPKPRLAYGIAEFAESIGMSRAFAYQEKAAGRLQTFKLGKRTLVSDEEARRYLAQAQQEVA